MEKKKEKRNFNKDVVLLIIGAILASVPTLISTYMQNESQLNQIIIDKRITALREYSDTYNRLINVLLPKAESLEERFIYMHDEYLKSDKIDKDFLIKSYKDFKEFNKLTQNWAADINTQILIINSLFNLNLELNEFYYYDTLKISIDTTFKSDIQRLNELQLSMIDMKKNIINDMNNVQKIMNLLSVKIK